MAKYLTLEDRRLISAWLAEGARVTEIAYAIGVHPSTVYVELRNKSDPEHGYDPEKAQRMANLAIQRRGNRRRKS